MPSARNPQLCQVPAVTAVNRSRIGVADWSDELFRSEDSKDRATASQRVADALGELICNNTGTGALDGSPVRRNAPREAAAL